MGLERFDEALECLTKARDLGDQMGYPSLMWKARHALSQVYNMQGKPEAAKEELEMAVEVIERMASKVSDIEVKKTFLASEPVQAVHKELKTL